MLFVSPRRNTQFDHRLCSVATNSRCYSCQVDRISGYRFRGSLLYRRGAMGLLATIFAAAGLAWFLLCRLELWSVGGVAGGAGAWRTRGLLPHHHGQPHRYVPQNSLGNPVANQDFLRWFPTFAPMQLQWLARSASTFPGATCSLRWRGRLASRCSAWSPSGGRHAPGASIQRLSPPNRRQMLWRVSRVKMCSVKRRGVVERLQHTWVSERIGQTL